MNHSAFACISLTLWTDLTGIFHSIALEEHILNVDGLSSRFGHLTADALQISRDQVEAILYNISHEEAITGYVTLWKVAYWIIMTTLDL